MRYRSDNADNPLLFFLQDYEFKLNLFVCILMQVELSNILEKIVDHLRTMSCSFLFRKPVTKKEAPDYFDIIERPMDLGTIRDKVRKMEYKNREDFRHDVAQIALNAHTYNLNRHPHIPPLADELLELCDYLLEESADVLDDAEYAIED